MRRKSTSWTATIWMACFAILLNALAPSISHAMALLNPGPGVPATWEICRAPGSTMQSSGGHSLLGVGKFGLELTPALAPKPADHQSMSMADCAYCVPHAGSFALPPPSHAFIGLPAGQALRPYLFYHAPKPLLALSAAPPRGPPLAS
jgi:hypothetical protein